MFLRWTDRLLPAAVEFGIAIGCPTAAAPGRRRLRPPGWCIRNAQPVPHESEPPGLQLALLVDTDADRRRSGAQCPATAAIQVSEPPEHGRLPEERRQPIDGSKRSEPWTQSAAQESRRTARGSLVGVQFE